MQRELQLILLVGIFLQIIIRLTQSEFLPSLKTTGAPSVDIADLIQRTIGYYLKKRLKWFLLISPAVPRYLYMFARITLTSNIYTGVLFILSLRS